MLWDQLVCYFTSMFIKAWLTNGKNEDYIFCATAVFILNTAMKKVKLIRLLVVIQGLIGPLFWGCARLCILIEAVRSLEYRVLIGQTAYVHPVTYAITALWLVKTAYVRPVTYAMAALWLVTEQRTYTPWRTLWPRSDWSNSIRIPRGVRSVMYAIATLWWDPTFAYSNKEKPRNELYFTISSLLEGNQEIIL